MINNLLVEKIIKDALIEDMNQGDITTDLLVGEDELGEAIITAKEDGVLAGVFVAKKVFNLLDKNIEIDILKKDGSTLNKGDDILVLRGSLSFILKGERLALNLLQRLSGIATITNSFVREINDTKAKIVDTRKTTPNLRVLEKYAVLIGGGFNHRYNLSDGILIKDNHIKAVGSIKRAVKIAKEKAPHTIKVEVEVKNLEELEEAISERADIIMLDNMDSETMKQAVKINQNRSLLEASGNMSIDRVKEVAETGVDLISVGAITHSVKALDISLNFK